MRYDTCQNCGAEIDLNAEYCDVCATQVYRNNQGAGDFIPVRETVTGPEMGEGPYRRPDVDLRESYVVGYGDGQTRPRDEAGARARKAAHAPPHPDSPYAPISTGGYMGILLLMLLPGVNLILLIVWALGGCRKIAKQSFARAQLVVGAVAIFAAMFMFYLAILAIEAALGMTISEFVGLMNAFL